MAETYCDAAPGHEWHGPYHDREYGFPLTDDAELFKRLVLEINQAGLSWLTILKKRDAFRRAYDGFDPAVVAGYGARDRRRLLADADRPPSIRAAFDAATAVQWRNRGAMMYRSDFFATAYDDYLRALARDPSDAAALDGFARSALMARRATDALDRNHSSEPERQRGTT